MMDQLGSCVLSGRGLKWNGNDGMEGQIAYLVKEWNILVNSNKLRQGESIYLDRKVVTYQSHSVVYLWIFMLYTTTAPFAMPILNAMQ